jgi:hypothetical protein
MALLRHRVAGLAANAGAETAQPATRCIAEIQTETLPSPSSHLPRRVSRVT